MFKKAIHFIQYNNATVLILAIILIAGTGVWAQTETGQEVIGTKQTETQGIDNELLLEVNLDEFDMNYKIEKVEEDEKYYYVTFTYLDIIEKNQAWQYQIQEKIRKVSKRINKDLGLFLAEELAEEREARLKQLKSEQAKALEIGESNRIEVTQYSGLIGQALDFSQKIIPGYEPVKKRIVPAPSVPPTVLLSQNSASSTDSFTDIYDRFILENDPDQDDVFGVLDNCPEDYNPLQEDKDKDGLGDACDEYFTLIPDIEATSTPDIIATSTDSTDDETGTSSDNAADLDSGTSTEEIGFNDDEPDSGTSTEEAEEAEPDVEIIELN